MLNSFQHLRYKILKLVQDDKKSKMITRIKHHVGNYLPALRSPNYRLYFFGQGVSLIGTWMAAVAEQWLVYPILTHDRGMLGIVSMVNLLPTTFLVLFAGVIADRVHKRTTLVIIQSLFAAISIVLAVLVFTKTIQIWHVFIATFLSGVIFAFDMPVRNSLMLTLVEKKDYPSALSLNTGIFNIARSIGPAIAGFTIAALGIGLAYFLNALSFLAVIGSILLMRLPPHMPQVHKKSLFEGFGEVLSYIKKTKLITALLFLIGVTTIMIWPVNVLMPVFAHDIYNVGEVGFGLMVSCYGIGAVLGAFGFSKLFESIKNTYGFLVFVLNIMILSLLTFALIPSYHLTLGLLAVAGWSVATFVNLSSTLLQLYAPNHLRGRMSSVYSFVLVGLMPLGAFYASYAVERIGPRFTIATSITILAVLSFIIFTLFGKKIKIKLHELR